MPNKILLFLMAFLIFVTSVDAEARRKKRRRSKGVVIVNQILKLSGTMSIDGKDVPEFSGVKEGNLLETGEKSYATVRIAGLLILKMSPQTQLKLTKFMNRDNTKFELLKGEVLFIFKRLGTHEVLTPKSKIIPIGNFASNTFFISNLTDGDEIALWDGKIQVSSLKAPPVVNPETKEETKVEKAFTSQKNYIDFFVDDESIEEEKESTATLPDIRVMQELESLYALP
ncbi:MAG: FecR domain-containing protein [Oligoflexia bacterium]|nr:FecR domain-containing protein [Oligoflexia bacterium]